MMNMSKVSLRLAALGCALLVSTAALTGCSGDGSVGGANIPDGGFDGGDSSASPDVGDTSTDPDTTDAPDGSTDPGTCAERGCSGHGQCVTEFETVNFATACEDTLVNSHENTQNYADDDRLTVYTTPADTVSNRILFKCDLGDIPPEATIQEAALRLHMYGLSPETGDDQYDVSLHPIVDVDPDLNEASWATYDGESAWPGGENGGADSMGPAVAELSVSTNVGYKRWPITSLVADWVQDPQQNRGMILDGDDSAAINSNRNFRSLEYEDPELRPELLISYSVPDDEARCGCDTGWAGERCDRCADGYTLEGESCVVDGCTPTSHASSACDEGDVYWFDSCGDREELRQDCQGAGCDDGQCNITFEWVEGKDMSVPDESMPEPDLGVPFTDEHYGTTVTRVTDPSQIPANTPNWIRHEYSRRQAYNVDSSNVLMFSSNGWWRLYALPDWSYVRDLPSQILEPNWHPTDPNLFYFFDKNGSLTIYAYDATSDSTSDWIDLGARIRAVWPSAAAFSTLGEGEPSADGRYWSLVVLDANDNGLGFVTVDTEVDANASDPAQRGEILGTFDLSDHGYDLPDHISTSPLGTYAVAGWNGPPGERAYTLDFSDHVQIHTRGSHADLGFDASGNEVWVGSDHDRGFLKMVDMDTGEPTDLFNIWENGTGTAEHISLNAFEKPGWAVVSFYHCRKNGQRCSANDVWYYDKIVLVELRENPRILNVAHTHRGEYHYWSEPQASANRDLTRIVFATSWGGPLGRLNAYEVSLPLGIVPDARP